MLTTHQRIKQLCLFSSQTDQKGDTSWGPVALMAMEVGSVANWSKTKNHGAKWIRWGTTLECSKNKPKLYPHQAHVPAKCSFDGQWNMGDFYVLGQRRVELSCSSQKPSCFIPGSYIQMRLTFLHNEIDCHVFIGTYTKTLQTPENSWIKQLYNMCRKPTPENIHEAAFPGGSPSHLNFRGISSNINFWIKWLSTKATGTLQKISGIFRGIVH